MSNIYYTRPSTVDRPGSRFNKQQNRNSQRNNSTEFQNQTAKPSEILNETNETTSTNVENGTKISEENFNSNVDSLKQTANFHVKTSETLTNVKSNDFISQKRTYSTLETVDQQTQKNSQRGRSRLFIGNIPSDITQDEFRKLFDKYGECTECFVNPLRGFGFVKLSSKQFAEKAKLDLDGFILRGKPLRIRFASQGAIVKIKNLSPNVSNELLKEAFEQYFGSVERAIIIVDDRGKSTGEGIVEFDNKPTAQKCLQQCTERCFFITQELKPIIVEPWDIKDEEDGLPEKTLIRNEIYFRERELKPRFAQENTFEYAIGVKWKQLESQEKQLLEEVKTRMQHAGEQVQIEVNRMFLDHQAQVLQNELTQRQADLRRLDELRSFDVDRRRNMMPMHHPDAYHQNQIPSNAYQYNDLQQNIYPNPSQQINDAAYTTNQVARGYNVPSVSHSYGRNNNFNQQQGFHQKRPRH